MICIVVVTLRLGTWTTVVNSRTAAARLPKSNSGEYFQSVWTNSMSLSIRQSSWGRTVRQNGLSLRALKQGQRCCLPVDEDAIRGGYRSSAALSGRAPPLTRYHDPPEHRPGSYVLIRTSAQHSWSRTRLSTSMPRQDTPERMSVFEIILSLSDLPPLPPQPNRFLR